LAPEASSASIDVSVIVPVHNGGPDLSRCLDAIRAAIDDSHEVIVVDDASTDGAVEFALESRPWIRVVRTGDSPVGPGVARNLAAASARGTRLVFIDADVLVHPDAIARLLEPLRAASPGASIAATIGSYDDRPEAPGIVATYANLRHHLVHQHARNPVPGFWTGLGAVRRDAFDSIDGFDAAFDRPSIEDVELGLRLSAVGRTVEVVPEAQGTHLKAWTAIGLWKTDLFARGIPWGRAIATHPKLASAMNGSPRARASILAISFAALFAPVAVVAWAAGFMVAAGILGVLAVVGLGVWVRLESELFGLMARHRGRWTAIGGLGFHAIHHLTVPAACLFGVMCGRWAVEAGRPGGKRTRDAWLLIAWMPTILAGLVVMVAVLLGPVTIHGWLADMEAGVRGVPIGDFQPRFDEPAVERILGRLSVLLLPAMMFGGLVSWFGPVRLKRGLRDVASCLRETFRLRLGLGVATGLLAAILLFGVLQSAVPMRTDEAATVMSHGLANPLVIMGNYETTNNHILHSLLVWTSIQCFGTEPWAVRLPAMLFCLACVPLIAIAAARLRSELAGLIAATIFVCLPSTLELATNARGYPIVIAAMLGMIALLPKLDGDRPGAGFLFALAGAVGLMAVPVMVYPLGLLYGGLFIGRWRSGGFLEALQCVPLAILTVLVAATWYLPAWIAAPDDGPVGTVVRYLPLSDENGLRLGDELAKLGYWLGLAWAQWVWPLAGVASMFILVPIAISVLVGLVRGGAVGMLAAGMLVGPAAVFTITGFGPPPWWTMVWIPPVLIVMLTIGFPWPSRGVRSDESGASVDSTLPLLTKTWSVAAITVAATVIFSMSPDRFAREYPNRVWIEDAGPVAAWFVAQDFARGSVRATGVAHGPVNYELHRRAGLLRPVEIAEGPLDDSQLPIRLLSPVPEDGAESYPGRFLGRRKDLERVDRKVVGGVLIRTFDRAGDR
jgi:GT2 family glycosyltransferase